jgi:hypothetical protein
MSRRDNYKNNHSEVLSEETEMEPMEPIWFQPKCENTFFEQEDESQDENEAETESDSEREESRQEREDREFYEEQQAEKMWELCMEDLAKPRPCTIFNSKEEEDAYYQEMDALNEQALKEEREAQQRREEEERRMLLAVDWYNATFPIRPVQVVSVREAYYKAWANLVQTTKQELEELNKLCMIEQTKQELKRAEENKKVAQIMEQTRIQRAIERHAREDRNSFNAKGKEQGKKLKQAQLAKTQATTVHVGKRAKRRIALEKAKKKPVNAWDEEHKLESGQLVTFELEKDFDDEGKEITSDEEVLDEETKKLFLSHQIETVKPKPVFTKVERPQIRTVVKSKPKPKEQPMPKLISTPKVETKCEDGWTQAGKAKPKTDTKPATCSRVCKTVLAGKTCRYKACGFAHAIVDLIPCGWGQKCHKPYCQYRHSDETMEQYRARMNA